MPASSPRHPDASRRVVRAITRLNIGGPAIQAIGLTTALESYGYSTRLVHGRLGEGEGDMSYLIAAGADVLFVPTLCRPFAPLDDLRTFFALLRTIRAVRPRLLHTHMAKAGMLGRLAAAAYNLTRGRSARVRTVHTYHGHVLEGYFSPAVSATFITLERLLARVTDAIVAISPAIRQELVGKYRIGRDPQYRTIPLGFDLAPFVALDDVARAAARRALDLPGDAVVVSTVGRLTAIKQHTLFLDTVAAVHARRREVLALIVGDGELRASLEAHAQRLGIGDRVRWLGWRRDLATIYGATDVFLLTSRNEGTPVALIEAMASGVASVSTRVGGVGDVIDSPDAGLLVDPADTTGLAVAVTELVADSARRRTMGAIARTRVAERFSVARLVADVARLYDDLLGAD